MERTEQIENRLKEIATQRRQLDEEARELNQERAQLAFDAKGFSVGQRMRFMRGRTQPREIEIVRPKPSYSGFDIIARTVKKGTGELGEEFTISAYDFGQLSPLEAVAAS